jgi:hypothetical protein
MPVTPSVQFFKLTHCCWIWLWWAFTAIASAATYYVSPTGSDQQPGTKEQPFATIQRAQAFLKPGDTVLIRGGVYKMTEANISKRRRIWAYVTTLDKSGTKDQRIQYWAYPGEKPIFDFSAVKPAGHRVIAFQVNGSWLHLKGLEVTGVQVTITRHTQSECFSNRGSHNIYEQLVMRDGMAIGIYLTEGSHNLFLNCDAYRNYDNVSENGKGGNTDGFGCHPDRGSVGNLFRGCRAWSNSDDGFDLISARESVIFDRCWAMYNGLGTPGDGNGFKAGGYGDTPPQELPRPIPRHVIQHCVAVRNKASGFYANHHPGGNDWFHNSAYNNRTNYNMLNRTTDNAKDVPGYGHRLKNNLAFGSERVLTNVDLKACESLHNSFDLPVTVNRSDFESLDDKEMMAPRQANGELPKIQFLHLRKGSDLVDQGIPLGFPMRGKAPDLGAFERP